MQTVSKPTLGQVALHALVVSAGVLLSVFLVIAWTLLA